MSASGRLTTRRLALLTDERAFPKFRHFVEIITSIRKKTLSSKPAIFSQSSNGNVHSMTLHIPDLVFFADFFHTSNIRNEFKTKHDSVRRLIECQKPPSLFVHAEHSKIFASRQPS